MPSPFPGMNPYLEQADHWRDFHTEFLTVLRRLLEAQIGPDSIILLEKHVYIHELPPEPRRLLGRPDVSAIGAGPSTRVRPGIMVMEGPTVVQLPTPELDLERVAFLEIRDRRGRELVTIIELLGPSNKRPGDDRSQYLAKRREVIRGAAHLVEIDLLRGWEPMPAEGRPLNPADAEWASRFRPGGL